MDQKKTITMTELKDFIGAEMQEAVKGLKEEVSANIKTVADEIDAKVKEAIKTDKVAPIQMKDNLEDDPKGGFKTMGHYFRDIVRCDKSHGRSTSKELESWEKVTKAAGTGLSASDSEYAGHLVPPEFRNQLMVVTEETNDILPRCTTIPMNSNYLEIPIMWGFDKSSGLVHGGIKWYWTDELAEYTSSRPKVEKISMKLKKLTGLCYLSDELIEFSPMSVQALVQRGFADGLSFALSNALIRGTGAGQCLGVINAPATLSQAIEVGQGADTILYENIVKMVSRFTGRNPVWIANPDTLPQLSQMVLPAGASSVPVFLPANGISGSPFASLWGHPLIFNDHASTVGDVGDILLCDWSQYWVGRFSGSADVKYSESMHVMFLYDQQTLKFSTMLDGQPSWPTYMTPQNSTNTRSPFVMLAARA